MRGLYRAILTPSLTGLAAGEHDMRRAAKTVAKTTTGKTV